jgi:hypothetical protein
MREFNHKRMRMEEAKLRSKQKFTRRSPDIQV